MKETQVYDLSLSDPMFRDEVIQEPGGEQLIHCFQCSSCTLSCPIAEIGLDLNPRRTIRGILLGLRKEVLESKGIWQCVGCFECTHRCPQDVRFTEVVEALRRIAVRSTKDKDKDRRIKLPKEGKRKHSFDKRFSESIWLWGRTWEPELIARYLMYGKGVFGMFGAFSYMGMMIGMVKKRKIDVFPHRTKGRKEVRQIFKKSKE